MFSHQRPWARGARRGSAIGIAVSCALLLDGIAHAQTGDVALTHSRIRDALRRQAPAITVVSAGTPLLAIEPDALDTPAPRRSQLIEPTTQPQLASRAASRQSARPRGLKALGGLVGGVGGFLLGGRIGAAIEGDSCRCDDPGFQGFLIGAPIGAVAGAILGTLATK
jgi:hypothetical protein